ncbi:hypothetical protein NQ314_017445 [Rhamnusium bicolor]|uniref:Major facilitator superfamily (MFS) profile domain-containing protein n=1 Tax=Rhamnusium bicolor TaxID=1586634 RepID=A0AAV8WUH4_9CUCU|nr:hypothetical protein NQ314_017445 [Rhamnusium bicolor]
MNDVEKTEQTENTKKKPERFFGVRHVQYALLVSVNMLSYGTRNILNVAIIAMVDVSSPADNVPTYPEWSDKKNVILSSFFWGYICLQILAGQIAKNYGPRLFLAGAVFVYSIFSILIPLLGANYGYEGVIACRIIQGLAQGFVYPSVHNLLSAWALYKTGLKLRVSFMQLQNCIPFTFITGSPLGTVIAMPVAGYLASTSLGWPSAFYLYGGIGILWCVLWFLIGSDNPEKHNKISEVELKYIHRGTSVEDRENSALSALPYLMQWLVSLVMSPIADYLVVKKITSIRTSRKIFNSIGLFVPALALFSLILVGSTEKTLTIVILVIAVGFNSATLSGFNVNHIDIAPVHAGTLMGLANTAATICAIVAPLAVDAISYISGYVETEKALWNIVFGVAATIYTVVGIIFDLTASGEIQPWNHFQSVNDKSPKNIKEPI